MSIGKFEVCGGCKAKLHRHGEFYRSSDARWIQRWRCSGCRRTVSRATHHPCFNQKKRRLNEPLYRLLCSGVSLRRAARLLRVHRITVVRKFHFLAEQARLSHECFLRKLHEGPVAEIFFDEMETFEHSKFKPVSIALAVTRDRRILSTNVARMPAKGPLAEKARKKYGYRRDERPRALKNMFETLRRVARPTSTFHSDQSPHYPLPLSRAFPLAAHVTTKGGRAAVVGQGEIKKLTWDPLFSLNHTAAMLRANVNRLFRRTWCTTKTIKGLNAHLAIYTRYHNEVLLAA